MKLIVGLGNPGSAYLHSRHNIGSCVVKALGRQYKVKLFKDRSVSCFTARVKIKDKQSVLAVPYTFMNLSGAAVAALVKKYRVAREDLLVICDDLDLDFGRIKIRPSGSSGGHRGLASIIEALKCNNFCRLRVGIGRPAEGIDASDYVLGRFSREETLRMTEAVSRAALCSQVWATQGPAAAMSFFNGKESIKAKGIRYAQV